LAGQPKSSAFARLLNAPFDERLSLVSLLLAGLNTRFAASQQANGVTDACYAQLKEYKQSLNLLPAEESADFAALLAQQCAELEAETDRLRTAGLVNKDTLTIRLQTAQLLRAWCGSLRTERPASPEAAFAHLRAQFDVQNDARTQAEDSARAALEAAFDFMEQAFDESQEMVIFVTELTLAPAAHTFIAENSCERYFRYNRSLLLDSRRAALQNELAAEERRNGGF
jgi:hypothetical protein